MKITRRNFLSSTGVGACAAFAPLAAAQESPASPGQGIWWPEDQALPSFGTLHHLDAANVQQLTGDQQVLLTTLQGVVNRHEPRLYWFLQGDNTDQTWLNTINVPYTIAGDPLSLVAKYRDEIRGAIVYDPNIPDSINV